MSKEPPPTFRYYADPFGEGRFLRSEKPCDVCERARGWVFDGLIYSAEVDDALICPWCIADGSAIAKWSGSFNEIDARIPAERDTEVRHRTPHIETWQDWSWPVHCDDACRYLGQRNAAQLRADPGALNAILTTLAESGFTGTAAEAIVDHMGYSPAAYHFRCLHCAKDIVTWDQD